jgi:exopolyphosphatase/guanosine-5'-triphosphate,3'-diphosphate pyrophosphatase
MKKNKKNKTIAVLDIGSNSICMVVYEGRRQMFNEKIRCALGADLEKTGRLNTRAKEVAKNAIGGFISLARAMQVNKIVAIATSAIRDAKDGRVFIRSVQKQNHMLIHVISGDREARFSAKGVLAAFPAAKGVVLDMGGGSAEFAVLHESRVHQTLTLPLGTLRMFSHGDHLPQVVAAHLDHLTKPFIGRKTLYLVGGTFRWVAKVHMAMTKKNKKLQGYSLTSGQAMKLAKDLQKAKPETLEKKYDVDKNRAVLLRPAGVLLEKTLRQLKTQKVVFSSNGLREGVLQTILSGQKV